MRSRVWRLGGAVGAGTVLLSTCYLSAQATWAPVARRPLVGINAVEIKVSEREEATRECHPEASSLRLAAAAPLLDAGLLVAKDSSTEVPVLSANVTALRAGFGCVAFVDVELSSVALAALPVYQDARLPKDLLGLTFTKTDEPRPVVVTLAMASLEERGTILTGEPGAFRDRVLDQVKRATTEIATAIRLANQKQ